MWNAEFLGNQTALRFGVRSPIFLQVMPLVRFPFRLDTELPKMKSPRSDGAERSGAEPEGQSSDERFAFLL